MNKKQFETENNKIKIDPYLDLNIKHFEKDRFIHAAELERVLDIIKILRPKAEIYNPFSDHLDTRFRSVHNTITLSGNRGSGKTSFLMSLKNDKELKNEIFFTIDPTLTEEKGHIFLNVISRIKEKVIEKCEGRNLVDDENFTAWNKYLKKLAAGMPLLDGVGMPLDASDWYDSTFVMEKGLHNIESANNLEENFHKFIKKSLDILEKKCYSLLLTM